MKVHFGGSSLGLRKIKGNYVFIRETLKKLDCTITRDWVSPKKVDLDIPSGTAFRETVKAIGDADAVILEGSFDTSSIGKQMILALNYELPVLILLDEKLGKDTNLDKFIDKNSLKIVKKAVYNKKNLEEKLREFIGWADQNTKLVRFNLEIDRDLDNYLKEKAKRKGTSKSEEIRELINEDMQKS